MRYYIQQGCLIAALILYLFINVVDLWWSVRAWPHWLAWSWAGAFSITSLVGIALVTNWIFPRQR